MNADLFHVSMPSPIGDLRVFVDARGRLVRLDFPSASRPRPAAVAGAERCAHVVAQLEEYFAGRRRAFELEVAPAGTPFQCQVWSELQRIPFGSAISYAELARKIGKPRAVRAVGAANGQNPVPIVVPCHRVVGADRSLTGFGGGLPCKRTLLELEGHRFEPNGMRMLKSGAVLPFAGAAT